MGRPALGLWLITDTATARHPILEIIEEALQAGFGGVMLREKQMDGQPLYDLVVLVQKLCIRYHADLVVNDRADITLCFPGIGLHTGARGFPVPSARKILGGKRTLGYSAHHVQEAQEAWQCGADYVSLSPVFPSITKPAVSPRGLEWFRDALAQLKDVRVMALGGIQPDNLPEIRECGAAGAFVMGGMMQASNPKTAANDLVSAWDA